MATPGLFYVNSRPYDPEVLDESTFMKWYDEHFEEILSTSGMKTAIRTVKAAAVDEKVLPYLALYPVKDIAFLGSDEFRNISATSDILPGNGFVFDLAEFDTRVYRLVQVYDPTKKGKAQSKLMLVAQYEMKDDVPADELDCWYREEHLEVLSKAPGYLRTTRFVLAGAMTGVQTKALKQGIDLATVPAGPKRPTHLALHEFETETLDIPALAAASDSEWMRKIHASAEMVVLPIFKVTKCDGEQDLFHGVEL